MIFLPSLLASEQKLVSLECRALNVQTMAVRRIDHLIVPVDVPPSSDLTIAQPVTFASMRAAKENAADSVDIRLLAARFADESVPLPDGFMAVSHLTRSAPDRWNFRRRRKLAFLKDILDRLYAESDAEYLIYTNVDIALQPHFYTAVNGFIEQGYDAFVINRRTISSGYNSPAELPKMYQEEGTAHRGYDCFIFRRELYPSFVIGDVFLGTGHVDLPLACSMIAYADNFAEFRNEHLTFHIGDNRSWWTWKNRDYIRACDRSAAAALTELSSRMGWPDEIMPHVQLMLRAAVLRNRIIVDEWLRLRENFQSGILA